MCRCIQRTISPRPNSTRRSPDSLAWAKADEAPELGYLKKAQPMGRNPQTAAAIKIKAKTVAKLYVAKAVKDAIAPAKK